MPPRVMTERRLSVLPKRRYSMRFSRILRPGSGVGRELDVGLLELSHQRALVVRLRQGLVGLDLPSLDQLEQAVVHQPHAHVAAGLDDRRDLEDLAFTNQVTD